ncbi:MAG TPA: single-stranded DNA-binding protein [Bdellovibrionota bacterium]|nr:single-stranded DNA-binding protein [Bdellovibrionota bacterium]
MQPNQIIVTGNLGNDPELHKKNSESKGVVSFSLAEGVFQFNKLSGKYEHAHTNWFPIKAFGSLAARAQAGLKRGSRVTVYGKLKTFKFERDSGEWASGFEILADEICPVGLLPAARQKPENSEPDFNSFEEGASAT